MLISALDQDTCAMASVHLISKPLGLDANDGFIAPPDESPILPLRNGHAPLIPVDPLDDFGEEDLLPTADKIKADNENRIKRKAKRPSRSVELPEETFGGGVGALSASLPAHFTFNGFVPKSWAKKYSKNSRRSRRGRGLAKKGGAGGKGTWGKLVDVEEGLDDGYDPNYDSDNQENCEYIVITPPLTEEEIEKHVTSLINEYFEHGDTEEVAVSLEEYNFDNKQYQIVVIAITLVMEHKSAHRELTSVLISDLYSRILRIPDYEQAFKILIKQLPDLVLDTPDADIVLGNFLARAVADDCIPPSFISQLRRLPEEELTPLAKSCIDHAAVLLEMEHGMVKLDTVWGIAGGMRPVNALVSRIQLLLAEYISSEDLKEASICLKELEVPHFHHELVYEAVIYALESMNERVLQLIANLLDYLCKSVVITLDQLCNGFNHVYEELSDICLDVPLAYPMLERLVSKCDEKGFMPKQLVNDLPQRGRKRFVSEGDGGKFKELV